MGKPQFKPNHAVTQVFDDLENYRDFCVEYGYHFDETHLYNNKSMPWKQYQRFVEKRPVRNNWREDAKQD